jgi:MoaA/NifB/PqqE/SkfB family radical SAM enzyme
LHCYSDSSPRAADELTEATSIAVVHDAADLGYDVVSVSGGEPLMYGPLPALLAAARADGMRTQLVSNGLMITADRLDALRGSLDLIAISIDGPADDHDRMRARRGTFARLEQRLAVVRESGIPFSLLFTLTMYNAHQIEWAAELAREHGARGLQVHPLSATGRAAALVGEVPDEDEAAIALLETARLRKRLAPLSVSIDVTTTAGLREAAEAMVDGFDPDRPASLSDLVSPLVVEPDGACVPLEYGFSRRFALGDVRRERLSDLAPTWLATTGRSFVDVTMSLADDLRDQRDGIVVSAYERFRQVATSAPVPVSLVTAPMGR